MEAKYISGDVPGTFFLAFEDDGYVYIQERTGNEPESVTAEFVLSESAAFDLGMALIGVGNRVPV
jgi:hypothetical protein